MRRLSRAFSQMFPKLGPAWRKQSYSSRGGACCSRKTKNTERSTAGKLLSFFRIIFHPELRSGSIAIFHRVFLRRARFLPWRLARALLFRIGLEAEQSDYVSHCLSQVLPKAMRILLFEKQKNKHTLQHGDSHISSLLYL